MARRRVVAPSNEVPFLAKRAIEDETLVLLAEHGERFAAVTEPPIPVDDIIELHLQLVFEVKDLRQLFGIGDVHGAIWINEGRIAVDESLDPHDNPRKLGRFRFTLGHETGHWRLHRAHYLKSSDQGELFERDEHKPAYICRSSQRKERVEWQADFFSACLLMPREMIHDAWEARRGNREPVALSDLKQFEAQAIPAELLRRGGLAMERDTLDNTLMEWYCRPLAEQFQVSAEAMRIRLEELGLLARKKDNLLF